MKGTGSETEAQVTVPGKVMDRRKELQAWSDWGFEGMNPNKIIKRLHNI